MAIEKKTLTFPFSRLKNNLVELQRWWPAFVKADSVGGLSVDPVLYRTNFGNLTDADEGGLNTEANTAGVRVEVISDAGTRISVTATTNAQITNSATSIVLASGSGENFSDTGGSGLLASTTMTWTGKTYSSPRYTLTGVTISGGTATFNAGTTVTSNDDEVIVEITGAGTMSPKCRIIDHNGTSYTFCLIAPTEEGFANSIKQAYGGAGTGSPVPAKAGSPMYGTATLHELTHSGPYPVFMTIQEFTEMLDTYRHIGKSDAIKPAFLPHGSIGRTFSSNGTVNPDFSDDNRLTNTANLPTTWNMRASVFMPMMLDNNQFDKRITGADISFAYPRTETNANFIGYDLQGITRYNPDPEGEDSSVIRYKELGYSGDHLTGAVGAWSNQTNYTLAANSTYGGTASAKTVDSMGTLQTTSGYGNPDISLDSTASIGPKYRMRMALACFLKNGTYKVSNGGDIIPYIYDSTRTIGGSNTTTLYSVWDGKNGIGDSQPYQHDCSAQIYPMFDFVQGPLSPSQQGSNFDSSVVELEHSVWPNVYDNQKGIYKGSWAVSTNYAILDVVKVSGNTYRCILAHTSSNTITVTNPNYWVSSQLEGGTSAGTGTSRVQPRQFLVRPNPKRIKVRGVRRWKGGDSSLDTCTKFSIYVDASTQQFVGGFGMPINLTGLTGSLGTGAVISESRSHKSWDGLTTSPVWATITGESSDPISKLNHNGWWIIESVGAVTTGNWGAGSSGDVYQEIRINTLFKTAWAGDTIYNVYTDDVYVTQGMATGWNKNAGAAVDTGANVYGIQNNKFSLKGVKGTSVGYVAGTGLADSNTPIGSSTNETYPSRITLYKPTLENSEGEVTSANSFTIRSLGIRSGSDTTFATAPSVSNKGGGILRIPPPIGWDIATLYYSGAENVYEGNDFWGTVANFQNGDYTYRTKTQLTANPEQSAPLSRWAFRGIHIPFWSYMDGVKGRNSWDLIKPNGWSFGRNRPWPPHERIGTQAGYSPSLSANASAGGWAVSATGNYSASGVDTNNIGLTEMGCSPIFLDMEMSAFIPSQSDRMFMLEFDNGKTYGDTGRHSMVTHGGTESYLKGHGFYPLSDGEGIQQKLADSDVGRGNALYGYPNSKPTYVNNRPVVWAWGGSSSWMKADWSNSESTSFPVASYSGNGGWGTLGNGTGYGGSITLSEGAQVIRTVFTDGGMNLILNGITQGTDNSTTSPIWGMLIKVGDVVVLNAKNNTTEGYVQTGTQGQNLLANKPNFNGSHRDVQIDSMVLRQIPTPSMLPFNIDSINQKITSAKIYNTLVVEANNINTSKGMNIKVSIMQPPSKIAGTIEQEATTAYAGFENLDLGFLQGEGSVDLKSLPASVVANGFMVRFHFYIPNSNETSYHPIDWNSMPTITSWSVDYGEIPTSVLAVTANTFNNDITPPISTKVGNVISFKVTGATVDIDRTLSSVKLNFGDGIESGYMPFTDLTLQSNTFDVSHVYTKAGTFSAVAYVKDDAGNISNASTTISVVVAEALPVAILKGSPVVVNAGGTVKLDGASSYIISTDSTRTIASYTFTAGDGSSAVTQAGSILNKVYATAGEYQATLTCVDNASSPNTSVASTIVLKILPAAVTVDLLAVLNTRPHSFNQVHNSQLTSVPTLDGTYPEVTDTGQRSNSFKLDGSFLTTTETTDIIAMEGYLNNGTLLTIKWQTVDYAGNASVQTFVGRMTSFNYNRKGGEHGQTPWTAELRREEA
tara:strand:+ start:10054 stop:15225 length:5172 start_codon:yes stop_codon:yes gene_type:complete